MTADSMFTLKGKTALVTGASYGLGVTFAETLAGAGAYVVLAARSLDKLQALAARLTAAGHKALAVKCDVGNPEDVAAMVDGRLAAFRPDRRPREQRRRRRRGHDRSREDPAPAVRADDEGQTRWGRGTAAVKSRRVSSRTARAGRSSTSLRLRAWRASLIFRRRIRRRRPRSSTSLATWRAAGPAAGSA